MKIKKQGNSLVAFKEKVDDNLPNMNPKIDVGESLGRINIKTGKFTGNTVALVPLSEALEKLNKKSILKETYKLWVVIEKRTEFTDGTEKFEDLKDNEQSAGEFKTLEEAEEQLREINEIYMGDFTND